MGAPSPSDEATLELEGSSNSESWKNGILSLLFIAFGGYGVAGAWGSTANLDWEMLFLQGAALLFGSLGFQRSIRCAVSLPHFIRSDQERLRIRAPEQGFWLFRLLDVDVAWDDVEYLGFEVQELSKSMAGAIDPPSWLVLRQTDGTEHRFGITSFDSSALWLVKQVHEKGGRPDQVRTEKVVIKNLESPKAW